MQLFGVCSQPDEPVLQPSLAIVQPVVADVQPHGAGRACRAWRRRALSSAKRCPSTQ